MKSLLILGCSATKRYDAGAMPAIERYDGPLFRVLRRWMRETPDHRRRAAVVILSAQYGLMGSLRTIPYYERRITLARAMELRRIVLDDLYEFCSGPYASVYISMGAKYREALPNPLPWPAEFATGGIGIRQRDLKRWLNERT